MTSGAIVRRRGILRTCSRINASLRLLMPLRARPISPSKTEEGVSAAFQVLEPLLVDLELLVVGRQDLFVPRELLGVEVDKGSMLLSERLDLIEGTEYLVDILLETLEEVGEGSKL